MQVYKDKDGLSDANWIIVHVNPTVDIQVDGKRVGPEDYLVICDPPIGDLSLHIYDPDTFHRRFEPDCYLRRWSH